MENKQNYSKRCKKNSFLFFYHCIPEIVLQSVCKIRKQNDNKYYGKAYKYTEKTEKRNIKRKLIIFEL